MDLLRILSDECKITAFLLHVNLHHKNNNNNNKAYWQFFHTVFNLTKLWLHTHKLYPVKLNLPSEKQYKKLTFPSWLRLCIVFLSLSCHHSPVLNVFMPPGSEEVKLTAEPAPWLKTIKPKVEIGHSFPLTDNSGTNVGDCKFPLTSLCPQTYKLPSGGGWVCVTQAMHTHTIYSCCRHRGHFRGSDWESFTGLWSATKWPTEWSIERLFVYLFVCFRHLNRTEKWISLPQPHFLLREIFMWKLI